MGVGMEIR